MLPTSTTNDSPDAQRRRHSARRSNANDGPGTVSTNILLALDSPAERVEARKRKLLRGRHAQQHVHPESQEIGATRSLDEGSVRQKKLSPANSSRSLDSAADELERERIERLRSPNRPRQSQSHHQRQSVPSQHSERSSRSTRSSLPDFKSILRTMIPSKSKSQEQGHQDRHRSSIRSASERTRTSYSPVRPQGQEVQSEHRRSTQLRRNSKRRGSDTDIVVGSERKDEAGRRKSSPSEQVPAASAASALTSPSLIKSLWRKSGSASQRTIASASSIRTSLSDDHTSLVTQDSTDDNSTLDQSDKGTPRRPLSSVLSSRLKRKTKRAELVQELSLRDSLRVRDRARGDVTSDALDAPDQAASTQTPQQSSTRQSPEFSTEETWNLSDFLPPGAASLRDDGAGGHGCRIRKLRASWKSPFDDSAHTLEAEEDNLSRRPSTSNTVAALLATHTITSSSSLVEVEGIGNKPSTNHLQEGHSSWPAASGHSDAPKPTKRKSRRSSSMPSKTDQGSTDGSTRKSKAKGERNDTITERRSSAKLDGRHSDKGSLSASERTSRTSDRLEDKGRLSASERTSRTSDKSTTSQSKKRRGSSVPPLEVAKARISASHGHSNHANSGSRSKGDHHKSHKATKPKEKPSSSSHSAKKKHASSSALLDPSGDLESPRRPSRHAAVRSGFKKKLKPNHDDEAESTPSKSHRHRRSDSAPSATQRDLDTVSGDSQQAKKSPRKAKRKESLRDASERSLTVDDIARLEESSTSLVDDSKTQMDDSKAQMDEEAKKKRKKKSKKASATSRLHSSSRSSKSSKTTSKSESRAWRSEPSGMNISDSLEGGLPGKDEGTAKKPVSRNRTKEKLTKKPPSSTLKSEGRPAGKSPSSASKAHGGSSRSAGKSPAPVSKAEGVSSRSKGKSPSSASKAGGGSSRLMGKSPHKSPKTRTKKRDVKDESSSKEAAGSVKVDKTTEASVASEHKSDGTRKEKQQVSIGNYLNKDGETKDSQQKAQAAVNAPDSANNDSLSRMPSLTDIFSVDLSIDSSKEDSSVPTVETEIEGEKPGLASKLARDELPLKEDPLSSLDAIAEDSNTEIDLKDLEGPTARDSLDVMRLQSSDIFHDSPNGSPLTESLPLVWERSQDAIIERLASSMPNLHYHHEPKAVDSTDNVPASSAAKKKKGDTEGIFQDDSDDSPNSQESPDLETIRSEKQVDVMSEIAGQMEERHENKPLQPRPSSESFRASLIAEFRIASPHRSPSDTTPASPRLSESNSNSQGKQDRGPRKPLRRSDSLDDDKSPPPLERLTEVQQMDASLESFEDETESSDQSQEDDPFPLAISSTKMEFHRTDDKGWVQAPPEVEQTRLSSSVKELHSSMRSERTTGRWRTDEVSGPRRRASMSDLERGRTLTAGERWSSSAAPKSDSPPSFSRQNSPEATERTALSVDNDELGQLFSLPKGAGGKELGRSYLPVSLQNAARRHERAGKQSPENSTHATATRKSDDNNHINTSIAVETGLSGMFEMIGELEDDLVKFENQVAFLRAQRARRSEESEGQEAEEPEAETES